MAKAKAPLFSFQARGSVGQVLTFRESARRHVVSTVPLHPDARSAAQLAQRDRYFHAKTYWHTLTPTEKAQLLTLARPDRITGYNLLLRQYLTDLLDIDAWWPIVAGQGSAVEGFGPNEYDGTITGALWTTDRCGYPGQALWFDGTNDLVSMPAPKLNYTSAPFSIVARIRPEDLANDPAIFSRGLAQVDGWEIRLSVTGRFILYTFQAGAWQQTRSSLNSIVVDTWYTVGVSRFGDDATIYINGIEDSDTPAPLIDPKTSARNARIAITGNGTGNPYQGKVHDVIVFRRALTGAEHLDIHQHSCIPPR